MLQDDHVTVQEAAEYLRISVATVYRLLRAGKLTGVRVKSHGAKGSLRVSRKLIFDFSDGHSKTASLEQPPPPAAVSSNDPEAKPRADQLPNSDHMTWTSGDASTSGKC